MKNFIKKPLNYILTGSFSIVFAACYGAPVDLESPKLIKVTDDFNIPIEGLKVNVYENRLNINSGYTDKGGSVEFNVEQKDKYNYKVTIEDVDGEENGEHRYFYPNGNIKMQGDYSMGKRHNQWKFFDEDGILRTTITYRLGEEQKIDGKKIERKAKGKS